MMTNHQIRTALAAGAFMTFNTTDRNLSAGTSQSVSHIHISAMASSSESKGLIVLATDNSQVRASVPTVVPFSSEKIWSSSLDKRPKYWFLTAAVCN